MRRGIFVVVTILAVAVLAGCAQSARPRISDINSDLPSLSRWSKERVSLFGVVSNSRVADAQPGAALKFKGEYDLTDEFGQVIHVKTTGNPPANGRELWVRGTISLDAVSGSPLLIQRGIQVNPLLIAAVAVLVALAITLTAMLINTGRDRKVTIPCPSCGGANKPESIYCQDCGKPMVSLPEPPVEGPMPGTDSDQRTGQDGGGPGDTIHDWDAGAIAGVKHADLTVVEGNGARSGTQFPLTRSRKTRIGRRNPAVDIQLDGDDMVSHEHAAIWWDEQAFNIQDLTSKNGTFVNGQRVLKHGLMDNDEIRLGRTKMVFRVIGGQKAGT